MRVIFFILCAVLLVFSGCNDKKTEKPQADAIPFIVKNGYFYKAPAGTDKIFIAGINLGVGVPGTVPGELAATKDDYVRWFALMAKTGFNSIRIYTLHYPRFYEAFAEYNKAHPEKPLYLFHGIWLDEDIADGDVYNMTEQFTGTIKETVDAIHGSAVIGERFGRAYGTFTTDISNWVIGWIIGRELAPFEVAATNAAHDSVSSFTGKFFNLESASPIEAWFAERLDTLADYESENYNVIRPLSLSSWPTLDPLKHPTETSLSFEDASTIDLATLDTSSYKPGYFASYHSYPYFPDFMNDDPGYRSYTDDYGRDNYIGYLNELKQHYGNKPLLVAEFGIPSSIGIAHYSISGMHHGGHDEKAQGFYIGRMFEAIRDSGCAGGMYFAWIDEWWKRTWLTDLLDFPTERRRLWHNITAPEQNFGLISFEPETTKFDPVLTPPASSSIRKVTASADVRYFYISITASDSAESLFPLEVGFDTYSDELGETILPGGAESKIRSEFALTLDNDNGAQLFVTEAYDLYGLWHYASSDKQLYHSTATDGGVWNLMRWKNSDIHESDDSRYFFPGTDQEIGRLRVFYGQLEAADPQDTVIVDGKELLIRIPWTFLQFTDPTQLLVMDDDRATYETETYESEGIRAVIATSGETLTTKRYIWEKWDTVPEYAEREKASLAEVKRFLTSFNSDPVKKKNLIAAPAGTGELPNNFVTHGWGVNDSNFYWTKESHDGCNPLGVKITNYEDGDAGWYFDPIPLSSGWYEYADYSRSDGRARTLIACANSEILSDYSSVGQSHFSDNFVRTSFRFYQPAGGCPRTILRTIDRTGTLELCSPELKKVTPIRLAEPLVSITFDDVWLSAAQDGAAELEKRGMHGSFYPTAASVEDTSGDYATETLLQALSTAGHEIGLHSTHHVPLSTITPEEMNYEMSKGSEWLKKLGITPQGIAFPYGDFDERVISAARNYFTYSRTSLAGLNDGALDRFNLRIFPVTGETTLDELLTFAETAIQENVWAIFLFHDLGEPGDDYEYRTSLTDFIDLLDYLSEQGVAVEPVSNVLSNIDLPPI